MKRSRTHIALVLFTLCVMTLTSTGFTAVVGYCSMTKASTCCCEESLEKCDTPRTGVEISAPVASCYTRSLAGGLNDITATTQSSVIEHQVALDVIPVDSYAVSHSSPDLTQSFSAVDDAAPPGVDIYIRINSILI